MKRRKYHVERPNEVWHINGHHKLIRWRMVIHGGIDGYSRAITYLCCNSNNKSSTVLSAFNNAVDTYGLPTKVRSDHGGENIEVWRKMTAKHGTDQFIIVGSSIHNEHIERLWRDVHRSVVVVYTNLFRELEEGGNLDSLNEGNVYCLHYVFIPKVNDCMSWMAGITTQCHLRTTEHLIRCL